LLYKLYYDFVHFILVALKCGRALTGFCGRSYAAMFDCHWLNHSALRIALPGFVIRFRIDIIKPYAWRSLVSIDLRGRKWM